MTSTISCPICASAATDKSNGYDGLKVDCPRCGDFGITGSAIAVLQNKGWGARATANISGWIRENQGINIDSLSVENFSSIKPPSVAERARKLLEAIDKKNTNISDSIDIDLNNDVYWLSVGYASNAEELDYLFRTFLMNEVGYLSFTPTLSYTLMGIQITPKGYEFLESLKSANLDSRIGFCAMWFDNEVLPIWTNAISLAIKDAGYTPKRIDSHPHNNKIDDEIIAMIRRSKFIVADFTGQRGGVYFEAGYALGMGLQVIWTCQKSDLEKIHFDTRQYNFLLWEQDKLSEFKYALQSRIEATLGHGGIQ